MAQVHLRYEGNSWDWDMEDLDLGDLSSDRDVKTAVAAALDAPPGKLDNFTLDRNEETKDITLRPQAVFGESQFA